VISADSSSIIAFLAGDRAPDTDAIAAALGVADLYLPPPVIVELLGGDSDADYVSVIESASLLPLQSGYWTRAREARLLLRSKGLRARAIDSLIAQCCIDAGAPLIARDTDFRHFVRWCGLKLAV
jgi:predicted nucleic acid-binding protein